MILSSLKTITEFLKQDKIKNMNMLYFMENNPIYDFKQIGNSVILRGESDHQWV